MTPYTPSASAAAEQKDLMTIYGLSFGDHVIFIEPGIPITYKGLLKGDDNGNPYVELEKGSSLYQSQEIKMTLPFIEGWQLDPSVLYSEANLRKIIEVWGAPDITEAVKRIVPEFSSLLKPGDEYYAHGVAKLFKDRFGVESVQNRIIYNILIKADALVVKDTEGVVQVYDLPPGESKRYRVEGHTHEPDIWIIKNGGGHVVGDDYFDFAIAQADVDILNERGPAGLSHPLPSGFTTTENPGGPWCVVSQANWVTDLGWQGYTEIEAIENFKQLNPSLCEAVQAGETNEESAVIAP